MDDIFYMNKAIDMAKIAYSFGDVPVGCVIVSNDCVVASCYNRKELDNVSTYHAEVLAINEACNRLGTWRLDDCVLYTTLEPCMMCMGAILQSRISRVVYGVDNDSFGYLRKIKNSKLNVKSGILKEECLSLLSSFFEKKRVQFGDVIMDNYNVFNSGVKPIKDLFEFSDLSLKYKSFIDGYDKLSKFQKMQFNDEISELASRLKNGIKIDMNDDIREVISKIVGFISSYGFSSSLFSEILYNTNFSITDIKTFYNDPVGLAMSSGESVYFDISMLKFDDKGLFKGFGDDKAFLCYVTIHELLHRISLRDNKNGFNIKDSALSEGLTDYFARIISGYNGSKVSSNYSFSVDICSLFVKILGTESVLSDYLNNIGVYSNLRNFFSKYGVDFDYFEVMFDKCLKNRISKLDYEVICDDERELIVYLRDNLLIPYIRETGYKEDELRSLFDSKFKNLDVSFDKSEYFRRQMFKVFAFLFVLCYYILCFRRELL